MTRTARRRGEPLVVLAAVVFVWLGLRASMWVSPFGLAQDPAEETREVLVDANDVELVGLEGPMTPRAALRRHLRSGQAPMLRGQVLPPRQTGWLNREQSTHSLRDNAMPGKSASPESVDAAPAPEETVWALLDAVSSGAPRAIEAPPRTSTKRWRLDGWLLVREGGAQATIPVANRPASYGASQAGVVASYRLGDERGPKVYARISRALIEGGETDFAAGLSIRPLRKVPVAVHGEVRVTQFANNTLVRPATFVVTELAPIPLPFGLRGEAYAQAGYVGGDFATLFVDGQLRIDREVARIAGAEIRVGGGTWGGAQKGSSRLDIGPGASVQFDLGKVPVRVSADYRFRVAGNAEPDSGVAVTLSSGF